MTYTVIYTAGQYSKIDAIVFTADGQVKNSVSLFDGENDIANIEVAEEDAERLEAMLDESDAVIEYRIQ